MSGFLQQSKISDVENIFKAKVDNALKPNVVSYTLLINGNCKVHRVDEAVATFDKMSREGIEPTIVTYNTLLDGICKEMKIDVALDLYIKCKKMAKKVIR